MKMLCKYILDGKELSEQELVSYLKSVPHETKLKVAPEIAKDSYSRLSWTPGEAQAARYDLSKEVKSIHWQPSIADKNSTLIQIHPNSGDKLKLQVDKNGKVEASFPASQGSQFEGKTLAEVIGKEHADKILSKTDGSLEGEGLKIGGEGMKGFYDQIIPKALEKIGKEHGVKVKQGFVEGNHDASLNEPFESRSKAEDILNRGGEIYAVGRNSGENLVTSVKELKELEEEGWGPFTSFILGDRQPKQSIHYIDIPQSLKDQALRKGFPLFSSGVMLSPVEQSPFEPKLTPVPGNPFE